MPIQIEINDNLPNYSIIIYSHNKHIASYNGITGKLLFAENIDSFSNSKVTKLTMNKKTSEYLTSSNKNSKVELIVRELNNYFNIKDFN